MPTIGELLGEWDEQLFVGRQRELATCRSWLDTPGPPTVLDVFGPGGVGKSALVDAFGKEASRTGRPVVAVDGRNLRATAEALLAALGGGDLDAVATRLNETRPLVVLDTFENLIDLTGFLMGELVPRLDVGVKVVVAGRYSLARAAGRRPWAKLVRPMPLEGLSSAESRTYLSRRGITGSLADQVQAVAGGYPLALTLAADLATQLDVADFGAAREWPLAVRAMVETMLREVPDPDLRTLLEACAVVRQFDEATLSAVAGLTDVGAAFDRLTRLSVVRPTDHGLTVADEVRVLVAEDLRWRQPRRHEELRARALASYRERMATAPPTEREWLLSERLYLWEHALVQRLLFGADEPSEVWVEPARPEDLDEVLAVELEWQRTVLPALAPSHFTPLDEDRHLRAVEALLRTSGARVRVARDRNGCAVGYSLVVAMDRASAGVVADDPVVGPLVRAHWSPEQRAALPTDPARADTFCCVQLATTGALPLAAQSALWRDAFTLFVAEGTYLCTAGSRERRGFLEALGFEPVAEARPTFRGLPMQGYVLDLTAVGVEPWVEAIVAGRRPPKALRADDVERELQALLSKWADDAALARSAVAALAGPRSSKAEVAAALRSMVQDALAEARASASAEQELAYRAVELAYLLRSAGHEHLAERLAVSRATFYRLLKRGVAGLAEALVPRPPTFAR